MQNLPCDTGNAKSLHKFTGDLERSMNEMFTEVIKYIDTVPDPAVSQVKQCWEFSGEVSLLCHTLLSLCIGGSIKDTWILGLTQHCCSLCSKKDGKEGFELERLACLFPPSSLQRRM